MLLILEIFGRALAVEFGRVIEEEDVPEDTEDEVTVVTSPRAFRIGFSPEDDE